ncbi:MAG: hypothetical protein ACMG57_03185, partial [Candidatus Dojkabacteria bacterium]
FKSYPGEYEFKGVIKYIVGSYFFIFLENNEEIKAGDDAADYKFVRFDKIVAEELGFTVVKTKILKDIQEYIKTNILK